MEPPLLIQDVVPGDLFITDNRTHKLYEIVVGERTLSRQRRTKLTQFVQQRKLELYVRAYKQDETPIYKYGRFGIMTPDDFEVKRELYVLRSEERARRHTLLREARSDIEKLFAGTIKPKQLGLLYATNDDITHLEETIYALLEDE